MGCHNILTKSRCLVKKCNLSESKILENRGQETNSQDSKEKPPIDGLLQYSPKDLYIFLINLIYHRIPPDTYKLWCELAERDVCFLEMSKDGVIETSYSLKHQRDQF